MTYLTVLGHQQAQCWLQLRIFSRFFFLSDYPIFSYRLLWSAWCHSKWQTPISRVDMDMIIKLSPQTPNKHPWNTWRDKHVTITSKPRFYVIMTFCHAMRLLTERKLTKQIVCALKQKFWLIRGHLLISCAASGEIFVKITFQCNHKSWLELIQGKYYLNIVGLNQSGECENIYM